MDERPAAPPPGAAAAETPRGWWREHRPQTLDPLSGVKPGQLRILTYNIDSCIGAAGWTFAAKADNAAWIAEASGARVVVLEEVGKGLEPHLAKAFARLGSHWRVVVAEQQSHAHQTEQVRRRRRRGGGDGAGAPTVTAGEAVTSPRLSKERHALAFDTRHVQLEGVFEAMDERAPRSCGVLLRPPMLAHLLVRGGRPTADGHGAPWVPLTVCSVHLATETLDDGGVAMSAKDVAALGSIVLPALRLALGARARFVIFCGDFNLAHSNAILPDDRSPWADLSAAGWRPFYLETGSAPVTNLAAMVVGEPKCSDNFLLHEEMLEALDAATEVVCMDELCLDTWGRARTSPSEVKAELVRRFKPAQREEASRQYAEVRDEHPADADDIVRRQIGKRLYAKGDTLERLYVYARRRYYLLMLEQCAIINKNIGEIIDSEIIDEIFDEILDDVVEERFANKLPSSKLFSRLGWSDHRPVALTLTLPSNDAAARNLLRAPCIRRDLFGADIVAARILWP